MSVCNLNEAKITDSGTNGGNDSYEDAMSSPVTLAYTSPAILTNVVSKYYDEDEDACYFQKRSTAISLIEGNRCGLRLEKDGKSYGEYDFVDFTAELPTSATTRVALGMYSSDCGRCSYYGGLVDSPEFTVNINTSCTSRFAITFSVSAVYHVCVKYKCCSNTCCDFVWPAGLEQGCCQIIRPVRFYDSSPSRVAGYWPYTLSDDPEYPEGKCKFTINQTGNTIGCTCTFDLTSYVGQQFIRTFGVARGPKYFDNDNYEPLCSWIDSTAVVNLWELNECYVSIGCTVVWCATGRKDVCMDCTLLNYTVDIPLIVQTSCTSGQLRTRYKYD